MAISCGDKNTDPKITPPTKEEVVKFQGTWGGLLNYKSGDIPDKRDLNVIFTINADGSIKDVFTEQTIALDKINKVSDNVFEFSFEDTQEGVKMTSKYKFDFTNSKTPNCNHVLTVESQGVSLYSGTYEGTLEKVLDPAASQNTTK
ncbi:hypothetical protein [uncultured Brachyspira sp.]|uniref:hypothetical protein n=1 Tax=uncultured Brachyspira sp. TaxID=221953 RepID=UPI0025CFE539|nr:hypothetical protein [uncultured Brachyspira sp.]